MTHEIRSTKLEIPAYRQAGETISNDQNTKFIIPLHPPRFRVVPTLEKGELLSLPLVKGG
jgi:hypothetical protein